MEGWKAGEPPNTPRSTWAACSSCRSDHSSGRTDSWRTQVHEMPGPKGVVGPDATPGTRKRPNGRGGTGHSVTAHAEYSAFLIGCNRQCTRIMIAQEATDQLLWADRRI